MTKPVVVVALLLFFINPFSSAQEAALLKLPVRVIAAGSPETGLKKDDFRLYINDEQRDIRDLFGKERAIGRSGEPRHFILAFDITEYSQQVADGIEAFVDRILTPDDTLTVLTPLNISAITASGDRAQVKAEIRQRVSQDASQYRQKRASACKNLLGEISKINGSGAAPDPADTGVTAELNSLTILQFLRDYKREWNKFKTRFLFPDTIQITRLALILARQGGEKWCINFQQREIMPGQDQFRKATDTIRNFLSSATSPEDQAAVTIISSALQALEKSMPVSENFPREILLNLLLGANIGYNTIFFPGQNVDTSSTDGRSADYEEILRDLSEKTGGVALDAASLADGIEAIRSHRDFYYDLIFEFNGKLEDKNIRVETTLPEAGIFYKNQFSRSEIQKLMNFLSEPTIKISGFSQQESKISFTISEFKIGKVDEENTGVMKVAIELIDDSRNPVYRTENTLRSIQQSITISLNLPAKYRGYFQLHIRVSDQLSLKSDEIYEYIKIK